MPTSDRSLSLVAPDTEAVAVMGNVLEGLETIDPSGQLHLGLASSVMEKSPTNFIYHLRPGLRFSDGRPVTAADVVYSLNRARNKKTGGITASTMAPITGVSSPGAGSVQIRLASPSPTFRYLLALYPGWVYEKAAAVQARADLGGPGAVQVGTGPYMVTAFVPGSSVTLVRNPYYAGPRPRVAKVTIRFLADAATELAAIQAGDIQGASYVPLTDAPQWTADASVKLLSAPGDQGVEIFFNVHKPPFDDLNVRRAMIYALDPPAITAGLLHGESRPGNAFVPPEMWVGEGLSTAQARKLYATLPQYSYDLAKARNALSQSAYPHGFQATITYYPAEAGEVGDALQAWSANLAKIGIHLTVREIPIAQYLQVFSNPSLAGVTAGIFTGNYPDPGDILPQLMCSCDIPPNGYNISNYRNPEADTLLASAERSGNNATRIRDFTRVMTLENRDLPEWTPWWDDNLYALRTGYVMSSYGPWSYLSSWVATIGRS
jgi:peptide/nickel transport system substrate-binding protein